MRIRGYLLKDSQQLLRDPIGLAITVLSPVLIIWVYSLLGLGQRQFPGEFRETNPLGLVLCLAVWLSALTSTAYTLYRERVAGTLMRISTMPYSPGLLVGSKAIVHGGVVCAQVGIVWLASQALLGSELFGIQNGLLLLALCLLGIVTVSLGLVLSVCLGSGQQIANSITLLTLVVVCLSGFLKPLGDLGAAGQAAGLLPFSLGYGWTRAALSEEPSSPWPGILLSAEAALLLLAAWARLRLVAPRGVRT